VRQAYFEDPAYVPLAAYAWRLWHELEVSAGRLLSATGVLELAAADDPLVPAVLGAGRRHRLRVEHLDAGEVRRRFPAVRIPDGWQAAFEADAGFVDPEAAVRANLRLATAAYADLRADTVLAIDAGPEPAVRTADVVYRPRSVVIAAGPWAPELLADRGLPVAARRKVVAHFAPLDESLVVPDSLPGFVIRNVAGLFYGFPAVAGQGVKVGRHDGGGTTTPDTVDRRVRAEEVEELHAVLREHLPAAAGPVLDAYTCLYTMSPDEHFLVGALPGAPGCFVATGCSGHAFKFVPALGEVLADLATGRQPQVDIGFLSPSRFAITG
jgi:sarcosine oxidase